MSVLVVLVFAEAPLAGSSFGVVEPEEGSVVSPLRLGSVVGEEGSVVGSVPGSVPVLVGSLPGSVSYYFSVLTVDSSLIRYIREGSFLISSSKLGLFTISVNNYGSSWTSFAKSGGS